MAPATLSPEEGAVANNVGEGHGSDAGTPARRLRSLHPDVAELLQRTRDQRTRKKASPTARAAKGGEVGRARYDYVFEREEDDEAGLPAPPRLVWAKVRGYHWWPAQVFDPADASELALGERRRRGAALVANFWERTYAWEADPAALRPFREGFPRFAAVDRAHVPCWGARKTMSPFASAVDAALGEVARRVDFGLSCDCAISRGVAKRQVVDNAGVREGAHGAVVDTAFARDAFRGEAFVEYLSALAVAPLAGADRLELTVATAQLRAFTRWRGTRGLPMYTVCYGIRDIADGAMGTTPARRGRASATAKRGRPRGDSADGKWKDSRCVTCGRARESVEDAMELGNYEPTPQPLSHKATTKMGKLMRRAARRMSLSPPVTRRADRATPTPTPPVNAGVGMARCTRAAAADHAAQLHDVPVTTAAPPPAKPQNKDEQPQLTGLLLNFTGPNAVPPATDLVEIFSRFGPVVEARPEGFSVAVVIFESSLDAAAAFAGTAKIGALSPNLISFRLAYSLSAPAAQVDDSPQSPMNADEMDHLLDEAEGMDLLDLLAVEALH
ncbi:hypothetical protein CFC21_005418 [Triticum aestivum]|uniref:PWWP domain-containing protein n=2 Tax=Triticum aestivum TaxID=4565 RepID=A0A9R1IP56_WHEAT|nr:uncharacterized protein LOC123077252 [Triticum aestivum]KAF6987810.1 hypothetical protein CFC21_005418 [Triticum aestivum]